jgi:hypothetical protein
VGTEAGQEAGLSAVRVSVWPGGLAGAGVPVLTTTAGPGKDTAQSGFGMVFGLASNGLAPGPGAGVVVLTTSAGAGKGGVQSGISTVFGLASSGVAPGPGAGVVVLTTSAGAGKGGVQSGISTVFGLASSGVAPGPGAGVVVVTTSAGAGKDGVPSGISAVFRLASSGVAPGPCAGVGSEDGKEAGPIAGSVKVRQGSLVTQLEATTVLSSRALLNHWNLAFFSLWTSGVIG